MSLHIQPLKENSKYIRLTCYQCVLEACKARKYPTSITTYTSCLNIKLYRLPVLRWLPFTNSMAEIDVSLDHGVGHIDISYADMKLAPELEQMAQEIDTKIEKELKLSCRVKVYYSPRTW